MTGTTTRRGRPPRISADQVVAAALELASDDLTIAAVARELGVAGPAIYRYFDSREALQAAVLGRVMGHLRLDEVEDWRAYLLAYAAELESILHRYPALIGVHAAQHWEVLGPLIAPILNGGIARLLSAGFTAREAVDLMGAVTRFVHSAAGSALATATMTGVPDFTEIEAGAHTAEVRGVLRDVGSTDVARSSALNWLLDGAAAQAAGRS